MQLVSKKERNSNLELYRIIVMLLIVAHHYVVNSGLFEMMQSSDLTLNSLFLYLFGMWGKTGINCFVLITGYFMCKSEITIAKFLKLVLEVIFYKVVIYLAFVLFGVVEFELPAFIKTFCPISNVGDGFTTAFILFYLFIPFINVLVRNLDKKMHLRLIILSLFIYTIWYMIPFFEVRYNYVTWFIVLFLIASYIRCYPIPSVFGKDIKWGQLTLLVVVLSLISVYVLKVIGRYPYLLVSDSNAILAICVAICSFMYFKDLKLGYSKSINTIAASVFGVLLIHANSDAMREWLWKDTLQNIFWFDKEYCILHAVFSVFIVFSICVLFDFIRIKLIEKPFFESSLCGKLESGIRKILEGIK